MTDDNLDWLEDDFGLDEESDRMIEPVARELLTLKLLREAIQAQNPDDKVMQDFAEIVLPNLLKYTIGVTAKGGKFFAEYLDRVVNPRRIAEGKDPIRRDNAADQSLNTHLLNGLFPANLIERRLQKLDTTVKRLVKEKERRLAIAGFVLHDFEKFDYRLIPNSPDYLIRHASDLNINIRQLSSEEDSELSQLFTSTIEYNRKLFDLLVPALGLDLFLFPRNPQEWQTYRDDLLYIACNAQRKKDTNLNLGIGGLEPELQDKPLNCLADLACLADRLSSIIKHPQDAESYSLKEIIHNLSDGKLRLTYHAISENRGVLTNVVNNALMDAYKNLNADPDDPSYTPLLYLPTGAIYLARRDAPQILTKDLPDRVVNSIKTLCAGQISLRKVGFSRGNVGMKYAEYYELFFNIQGLMQFAVDGVISKIRTSKAADKSQKLLLFKQNGELSEKIDIDFPEDIRVDHLAELGALIVDKFWKKYIDQIITSLKKTKKTEEISIVKSIDLTMSAIEFFNLSDFVGEVKAMQNLKNTGGVSYEWYYIAKKYLERNPGLEDVRLICQELVNHWLTLIKPIIEKYEVSDGWDDIRDWVSKVVMLPGQVRNTSTAKQANIFLKEFSYYRAAKKPGRGRQMICSISHSPYSVSQQMESAVLFTPQVYTNKQHLGGSNAKRNISSIAGIEMMLRQVLMNQTQAVGKKFEDGKYRYLYFYPTYYFTPETNSFLQRAYSTIAQTRFDTSIRNHFISKDLEADFSRTKYQTVDTFLMEENLAQRKQLPEDDPNFKRDRTFKLSYPEDKPLTFYFMALPAPMYKKDHKPTDTESWIMPAWLALSFPMILDVKTVVSESPVPPFIDGSEFEETVFLDSAPQAFRVLIQNDRFRLDSILEGWTDDQGSQYPAPLNALTATYAIHLDVNPKQDKGKYNPNWGKFVELAVDLETSPLYVFSYLAKWSRSQKLDAPHSQKIRLYAYDFYPCFDPHATYNSNQEEWIVTPNSSLNHPKQLTDLYRQFYRANKRYNPKANAVLKPIDIAADTILKAEFSMFHDEALIAVVAAEVCKLMDRVHSSTAEGRWIQNDREKERQLVLDFAQYFVIDVFEKAFAGDRARLAGRQLNLIRDTCEFLYRLEEDKEIQLAKNMVMLYRQFYRVNKPDKSKTDEIIKPVDIAADVVLKAESDILNDETLVHLVSTEIVTFMDQIHNTTDKSHWIVSDREQEKQLVQNFAQYFVIEIFNKFLKGDSTSLENAKFNWLRDSCKFFYRSENRKENKQSNNNETYDENGEDE